jgi:hypothetical protein
MKKYAALVIVLAVASSAFAPAALAADDGPMKKVGNAIVWPFKKMGQGLKAVGNGTKKIFKRGS